MKNKYLIWIVALLWVSVLVVIYTQHARIITTGKIITLKTEPIDPRDPFKGDNVKLLYDISTIQSPLTDAEKSELLKSHRNTIGYWIVFPQKDLGEKPIFKVGYGEKLVIL
jgi:uncharacterized membrane-anchored protein